MVTQRILVKHFTAALQGLSAGFTGINVKSALGNVKAKALTAMDELDFPDVNMDTPGVGKALGVIMWIINLVFELLGPLIEKFLSPIFNLVRRLTNKLLSNDLVTRIIAVVSKLATLTFTPSGIKQAIADAFVDSGVLIADLVGVIQPGLSMAVDAALQILKYRINIPILTFLYEHVITSPNPLLLLKGTDLTLMSLLCLFIAHPITLWYKIASGGSAPFSQAQVVATKDLSRDVYLQRGVVASTPTGRRWQRYVSLYENAGSTHTDTMLKIQSIAGFIALFVDNFVVGAAAANGKFKGKVKARYEDGIHLFFLFTKVPVGDLSDVGLDYQRSRWTFWLSGMFALMVNASQKSGRGSRLSRSVSLISGVTMAGCLVAVASTRKVYLQRLPSPSPPKVALFAFVWTTGFVGTLRLANRFWVCADPDKGDVGADPSSGRRRLRWLSNDWQWEHDEWTSAAMPSAIDYEAMLSATTPAAAASAFVGDGGKFRLLADVDTRLGGYDNSAKWDHGDNDGSPAAIPHREERRDTEHATDRDEDDDLDLPDSDAHLLSATGAAGRLERRGLEGTLKVGGGLFKISFVKKVTATAVQVAMSWLQVMLAYDSIIMFFMSDAYRSVFAMPT